MIWRGLVLFGVTCCVTALLFVGLASDEPADHLVFATWGTPTEIGNFQRLIRHYNSTRHPEHSVKLFGINGLLILMTIYFFQGIAIISFYFEKKHFPRLLRIVLYSLIALQQIVLLIVVGLGNYFRRKGR